MKKATVVILLISVFAMGICAYNESKCASCHEKLGTEPWGSYKVCIDCYNELSEKRIKNEQNSNSNNKSSQVPSSNKGSRSSDAWVCAQDIAKSSLRSPSTAKFCSYVDASITCTGGNDYTVSGYVDAENGFGATVRSYFTVTLTLTEKGYTNGYVSFS